MTRILIALCLFIAHESPAIEFIAHRGYACGTLENTVKSVQYAWLAGADGVELDLRVSRDGIIFLYHDDNINGQPIDKLDYEDISSPRRPNAPKLEQILALGEPPGYFILDLKETDPNKYEPLPSLLAASGIGEDRFVIQSTNIVALAVLKKRMPNARFLYLSHLKRTFPLYRAPKPKRIIANIAGIGLDGVSLKGRQFIDEQFVMKIRAAGYDVNIWTINDPDRAIYYRDIGVDGLITDFVEELRSEVLDGKKFEKKCLSSVHDAS